MARILPSTASAGQTIFLRHDRDICMPDKAKSRNVSGVTPVFGWWTYPV
ncbi:MAG: hypothetical protein WA637_00375 [Terriglobales bacterium]